MSDAPARNSPVAAPVTPISHSIAVRSTRWMDGVARQALTGMERTALRWKSGVRGSGPFGWAGLGLLFAALVATWTVVLPQRQGLADLRETVASSEQAGGAHGTVTASPRRQTAEFLRQLPTRRDVPAILGIVLQQAQAAELGLDSGTYEWRPAKDGGVGEYRIVLPVRGTYPAIRGFIEKTLAAAPPVALESLHFARDDVTDSAVDAEISFVIFLGNAA
jgi:hypothetical protein